MALTEKLMDEKVAGRSLTKEERARLIEKEMHRKEYYENLEVV